MTWMELLKASNDWGGSSLRGSVGFARKYPWTVAFLLLFIAMIMGFSRVETLQDAQNDDRVDRRAENLLRDQQFCRAIPAASVAGAQALVNILIADARGDKQRIPRLQILGRLYTKEARRLASAQLPECEKILASGNP